MIVGVIAGARLPCPFCTKTCKNQNVLGTHISREHRAAAAGSRDAAPAAAAGDAVGGPVWKHVDRNAEPVKVFIEPEGSTIARCAS